MGKGASMETKVIHRYPSTCFLLICALFILVGLPGCAGFGAQAHADAQALYQSGRTLVIQNHDLRRWVREQCIEILKEDIAELRRARDNPAARARLAGAMPDLITVQILDDILDEKDGKADLLAETYCS